MYNNDEKKKKSWVPEGMKGVMNKMQSFNKNQDPKANLQFFDPDLLEEIIKKQLIEKNPKLINDKALLEETIRKAFKDRNLVQKPNKIESPPKNNLPLNKKEVFSMDLLDIGQETNDVKLLVNPNPIFESKEIEIESTKEKFFEEKKSEDIKLLEKKAEIQTQKIENKDKAKINEEINIKYSFLQKTCYFKFETIQEISSVLHQKICENIQKPDINIDKTFIIKVLENLEYLRKYQIENRILEEKFQSTVIDYSKMQERLINQENLLKSIEYTYHEKINEIEHSHQEKINTLLIENKNLKNIIEGNERKISLQLENFKEEISQSQETIKKLQNVNIKK